MRTRSRRVRIKWTTVLVYVSLIFVASWLLESEQLRLPTVDNPAALAVAVPLVFLGFLASALAWWKILSLHGQPVSLRLALASTGVTIFGKYVPGKVWVVIGRAGYIAERGLQALSRLSLISLKSQLITLWIGLPLGALVFIFAADETWRDLALPTLGLWTLMSALLFSGVLVRSLNWLLQRLGRSPLDMPSLSPWLVLRAAPWFLFVWLAWCLGFALLVAALSGEPPQLADGLAFVLAATLAVLAVIAPGGLGVREGLLVLLLVMLGHPAQFATTVSVIARLWFLAGEVMLFVAGLIAQRGLVRLASRHD
jgi:uncharacterized membrane protein YbhN (UPF0104 family)